MMSDLRTVLSRLYSDSDSIKRVASDAGLKIEQIAQPNIAVNFWQAILVESVKSGRVQHLIDVARMDYPANQELLDSSEAFVRQLAPGDAPNSDFTPTWRTHEASGDEHRQMALRANSLSESDQHWLEAKRAYQKALGEPPDKTSLDHVRLLRKMAICSRKLGQREEAADRLIPHALRIIKTVRPQAGANDEEALLLLEAAFCSFDEEDWPAVRVKAEEIVRHYDSDLLGQTESIRYVIGNAFNLMGIMLHHLGEDSSTADTNSITCWRKAISCLETLDSLDAQRTLRDVNINFAMQLFDKGDCDQVIHLFTRILDAEAHNDANTIGRLPASDQIAIRHTLAGAHLERQTLADLEKANELAQQNLQLARTEQDLKEWTLALEQQLKVMIGQLRLNNYQDALALLEKAKLLRGELDRAKRLQVQQDFEQDEMELYRLFTEIYVATGQPKAAQEELSKIGPRFKTPRDEADVYATRALLHEHQGDLRGAIFHLGEACSRYRLAGHDGVLVDALLRLARLHLADSNQAKAKQVVDDAAQVAAKLGNPTRIGRVSELRREITLRQAESK